MHQQMEESKEAIQESKGRAKQIRKELEAHERKRGALGSLRTNAKLTYGS